MLSNIMCIISPLRTAFTLLIFNGKKSVNYNVHYVKYLAICPLVCFASVDLENLITDQSEKIPSSEISNCSKSACPSFLCSSLGKVQAIATCTLKERKPTNGRQAFESLWLYLLFRTLVCTTRGRKK